MDGRLASRSDSPPQAIRQPIATLPDANAQFPCSVPFVRTLIRGDCWAKWMKDRSAAAFAAGQHAPSLFVLGSAEDMEAFGLVSGESLVKKCTGGYVEVLTGEFYATPWEVRSDEVGLRYIVRKEEVIR
jgi:hypothetical protein